MLNTLLKTMRQAARSDSDDLPISTFKIAVRSLHPL